MIRVLIDIYIILILLDAILSYIPNLKGHPYVQKLRMICEFSQRPIRKYMPQGLPLDPSPIVVILLLKLVEALW
jgi:YggT family protein